MNPKYLSAGLIAFIAILGWNVFLVQRDDRLFKAYYHQTAQEQHCNQNASAATCNVK